MTTSYKKDASNLIKFHLVLQMLQMAEYHARTVVSVTSLKRPSMKVRKQKLLNFLQGMLTSKHVVLQPGNLVHSSAFWLTAELISQYFYVSENYEPVYAKWTTERCAVCRWVEDWDYNKIVICNRFLSIRNISCPKYTAKPGEKFVICKN